MVPTKKHTTTEKVHRTPKVRRQYTEAVGRRKTAVVRVRIYDPKHGEGTPGITVNGKKLAAYFPLRREQQIASAPLRALSLKDDAYAVSAHASGGGVNAQAEALCLGLARTLIVLDATVRPRLKALGYLKRDPRAVERKKFGSRKARRPQQWRKR
jgi:small subunit ribosomal protein S9